MQWGLRRSDAATKGQQSQDRLQEQSQARLQLKQLLSHATVATMADTALTSPLSPQSPGGASATTKAPAMSMNSLWRASKCSANTCYIFTVLGIIVSAYAEAPSF